MKFSTRLMFAISLFLGIELPAICENKEQLISANGAGVFLIGMSLGDVNQRLHEKIIPHEVAARATPSCDYNEVPELPGVAFVFIDDKLMRIDMQRNTWLYKRAVKIGMSRRNFLHAVRNSQPEPLDHISSGISYVVSSKNSPNAISFQFEKNYLSKIIAGDNKVIRYAEACM